MNMEGLTQKVVKPCSHWSGRDSIAWRRSATASLAGKVAADAAHHFQLIGIAVGGGHRRAKGLEFFGLRTTKWIEAMPVADQPAEKGGMQPLAAEP